MKQGGRVLVLVTAVNAAALLGCTALQNLQGTNTNKPAGSPTPASTAAAAGASASATPAPGAAIGDRLNKMGSELTAGFAKAGERLDERQEAPRRAIDAITPEQERAIGQAAALNIIQQSGGLVLEEKLTQYVNGVANYVAAKGVRTVQSKDGKVRIKARRFFVGVLASDEMNAFALPGGYILLTRGLVENLACESDLAWVLGHEIAHVDNEDGLSALKKAIAAKAFVTEWSGTAGDSRFDNPVFFEWVADKLANIVYKVGLDRDRELLADKQGLEYTTKGGYDSRAPKRVLQLLSTMPATKVRLFASHDTPARRLEILGQAVETLPNGKLGIDRFDRDAIQRIEAVKLATPGTAPGSP